MVVQFSHRGLNYLPNNLDRVGNRKLFPGCTERKFLWYYISNNTVESKTVQNSQPLAVIVIIFVVSRLDGNHFTLVLLNRTNLDVKKTTIPGQDDDDDKPHLEWLCYLSSLSPVHDCIGPQASTGSISCHTAVEKKRTEERRIQQRDE